MGFLLYICNKFLKMKEEILEAFLKDVKKIVENNPNDTDLGKTLRSYFNNLPKVIEDFKQELNKK